MSDVCGTAGRQRSRCAAGVVAVRRSRARHVRPRPERPLHGPWLRRAQRGAGRGLEETTGDGRTSPPGPRLYPSPHAHVCGTVRPPRRRRPVPQKVRTCRAALMVALAARPLTRRGPPALQQTRPCPDVIARSAAAKRGSGIRRYQPECSLSLAWDDGFPVSFWRPPVEAGIRVSAASLKSSTAGERQAASGTAALAHLRSRSIASTTRKDGMIPRKVCPSPLRRTILPSCHSVVATFSWIANHWLPVPTLPQGRRQRPPIRPRAVHAQGTMFEGTLRIRQTRLVPTRGFIGCHPFRAGTKDT